jgi:agmatinase
MSGGEPPIRREDLQGSWAMGAEQALQGTKGKERMEARKLFGIPAAETVRDRNLTLFSRGGWYMQQHGTFGGVDFLEDMRQLGGQDVAFVGAPYDGATTFRPGTRFGPDALRRVGASWYNPGFGVDLMQSLNMVDVGNIQIIPSNLEKSFDQIAAALSYIAEREIFPIVLGGDHAIGYPDVRGIAPFIDGNIGIIHFDRHADISENSLDERMHGSPFFHATNIPNAPPTNLVQIGVGGWSGPQEWFKTGRERQTTMITMDDIDRYGVDRIVEYALEIAWRNAKAVWVSFDIDSLDPAFAPGTGTPVAGGLLPREAFQMIRGIAREGLIGMELVEISPPYDQADRTAMLGAHLIRDCLGTLVAAGKLGTQPEDLPERPY